MVLVLCFFWHLMPKKVAVFNLQKDTRDECGFGSSGIGQYFLLQKYFERLIQRSEAVKLR